ncbi:hypothetical protein Pvag_pPag20068 (plasmid) [Pantoea vagans C9-1]|nr:hypothetical protein Pvag_pPag20068 [Pantoea vagans C9-1]
MEENCGYASRNKLQTQKNGSRPGARKDPMVWVVAHPW